MNHSTVGFAILISPSHTRVHDIMRHAAHQFYKASEMAKSYTQSNPNGKFTTSL